MSSSDDSDRYPLLQVNGEERRDEDEEEIIVPGRSRTMSSGSLDAYNLDKMINRKKRNVFTYVGRTEGGQFFIGLLLFLAIIFGGALFYTFVEGWTYDAGIYFMIITVTTIGYGDYHPETKVGRIALMIFALGAIIVCGFLIQVANKKISLDVLNNVTRQKWKFVLYRRREIQVQEDNGKKRLMMIGFGRFWISLQKEAEDPLSQEELESKLKRRLGDEALLAQQQQSTVDYVVKKIKFKTFALWGGYMALLLLGGLVFYFLDRNTTYFQSVYFCFITLTTIGYGDYTPSNRAARWFVCVYALVAIFMIGILINHIGEGLVRVIDKRRVAEKRKLSAMGKVESIVKDLVEDILVHQMFTPAERSILSERLRKVATTIEDLSSEQILNEEEILGQFRDLLKGDLESVTEKDGDKGSDPV